VHRWFGLDEVPQGTGPSVLTLGNFDGVHRGHAAVLGEVVREARSREALAVAVTFDPHPLQVLHPDTAPESITGLDQRLDLLAGTGLDAVVVQPFTRELAAQTPAQYVESVFVRALGAVGVVIGADVRFGVKNSGDITALRQLGEEYGFDVVGLDDLGSAPGSQGGSAPGWGVGKARRWSSTWVRELLAAGDVAAAADVLGRRHAVLGTVVHGQARGRDLGYPTANIGEPGGAGLIPADGVYAGWLVDDAGTRWPSAISVGTNPQFGEEERRVEAHVIDRTGLDLYGRRVAVEFERWLRPMVVFDDLAGLLGQMRRDVDAARAALRGQS